MDKKVLIYGTLLALVIGLIIYIDANRPKPVDWTPTYNVNHKIPFGLYVLEKESETLFANQDIKKIVTSPYEYFEQMYDYDNDSYRGSGTYLKIEEENSIDGESVRELMNFVSAGNTVFLGMKVLPQELLDTLQIKVANNFYFKDSIAFATTGPSARKQYFSEGVSLNYFDSINPKKHKVLGYQYVDTLKGANFIRVPMGRGNFLLHTQPAAFSNFHLLKGEHYKYAEDILAVIPPGTLYWQTSDNLAGESGSPLRYILSQPPLKWALYLALISLFIFMLFNAKRKQRIIAEIEPVRNTTVDFAKTIGNLYYQERNHHTIIEKKIIYLLEKIRREYMIDTYSLDDAFVERLHLKSGIDKDDIQNVVNLVNIQRHKFESTEADVIEINKAIEKLRL